jgi:hypothetical protein
MPALGSVGSAFYQTYCAETSFGVPPVTPTMKAMRSKLGAKFDLKKNTITSKEQSSTGQVMALGYGNRSGSGDIPFEQSYGSYDDFMEAAFGGTWTGDVLKIGAVKRSFLVESIWPDINYNEQNTGVVINGASESVKPDAIVEGSFTHTFKDQKCVQYADDGVITTAFAATTLTRSTGSYITDGFAVGDSVIITGAATPANNCGIAAPAIITTLAATIMTCSAAAFTVDTAKTGVSLAKTMGTPTAANTNAVFDSFTGAITLDGVACAIVTGIDWKMEKSASASNVVFDATAQQIALGIANVTGTVVVRFINGTLKKKFLAGTSADIAYTLGSGLGGGKSYKRDFSTCYFTGCTTSTDEKELTQSLPFTAIYNATDATTMMITRIP